MAGNTIGQLFTLTHLGKVGPALGAVVDGCPPGRISVEDIQLDLDSQVHHSKRKTRYKYFQGSLKERQRVLG